MISDDKVSKYEDITLFFGTNSRNVMINLDYISIDNEKKKVTSSFQPSEAEKYIKKICENKNASNRLKKKMNILEKEIQKFDKETQDLKKYF